MSWVITAMTIACTGLYCWFLHKGYLVRIPKKPDDDRSGMKAWWF